MSSFTASILYPANKVRKGNEHEVWKGKIKSVLNYR